MPFRTCCCNCCRGRGEVLFSFLISCRRLAAVARHPGVVASRRATERRPAGPCPLGDAGALRASTAERDRKAAGGRARCDEGSYGHRQQREGFPFPPKKTGQLRPWSSFFSAATMAASAGRKGRVDASSGSIQRRVCPSRLEGCPSKAVTWKKCRRTWRPRSG